MWSPPSLVGGIVCEHGSGRDSASGPGRMGRAGGCHSLYYRTDPSVRLFMSQNDVCSIG